MDKSKLLSVLLIIATNICSGQTVVTNYTHTQLVLQNYARRTLSESIQQSQTEKINSNLDNINKNLASVNLVKNQIYNSLVNVNEALKDGKTVLYMGQVISDIGKESSALLKVVKNHPQFAPFAERQAKEVVGQAIGILDDINTYIIGSNKELLMDYNARDEVLATLSYRLRLLRGALYSTRRSITWAVRAGLWKSLNPFQSWINQDKVIIDDIMRKQKALKL